ncbi:MucBP domain-containing protein, partial [Lactococcus garvieae]|uniref:MucBP domain-containing protein n=1 Tax=Lactococcus garvieae TaxID=1363 RepID=UPI0023EB8F11
CSALTTLDLSKFDTSNVTSMNYMFYGCSALTTLDLSKFDTSNVTSMNYMFNGCSALTTLDLSKFDTSKVTTMNYMFSNTTIKKLTLGLKSHLLGTCDLNPVPKNNNYTGKWQSIGTGTPASPNGTWSGDTADLISRSQTGVADTYVWQPAVPAADVTVKYEDTDGKSIHASQTISGNVGDTYDATTATYKLAIDGYTLDASQLPANATGTLSATAQTVTYVYTKNPAPAADVTVKYVDTDGKSIHASQTISGNVGDTYDATTATYKLAIDGYTLDASQLPKNATGTLSATAQTVTYVYKENSTPPSKQEVVNVYRLYNKKSMEHLYTADAYEYKHLPELSSDWVREGINFKEYKKSDSTTVTVHRVYNPKSGEHLNTTDSTEVKVLTSKGWKSEGVAFYTPKAGGKPVYRLFNPKAGIGAHFMTADSYEKSVLTKAPKEWKYEGVAWNSVK